MSFHDTKTSQSQTANKQHREFGFIKKLNKEKGYAFIDPESGGNDVFLSLMHLSNPGHVTINVGQRVSFRRYRAPNGKQRATDVAIAEPRSGTARINEKRPPAPEPNGNLVVALPDGEWQDAMVKFYDPEKGYGFVEFQNGTQDAFLSRRTVQASQLDPSLRLSQVPAKVITVAGRKQGSIEVLSIVLN